MHLLYDLPNDVQEIIVKKAVMMNKTKLLNELPKVFKTDEALYTTVGIRNDDEMSLYHFIQDDDQHFHDIEFLPPRTFLYTKNMKIGFSWFDILY